MAERHSNLGYIAIKKQSAAATAVTPDTYLLGYEEDFTTDGHFDEINPIAGQAFKRWDVLRGIRSHGGSFTVQAEPNTAGYLFDMFTNRTATSGSDPYTHTFKFNSTDSNYYTLDLGYVSQVVRFWGVAASDITPSFEGNEMRLTVGASALYSWAGREVSTVTGAGPYTITFKTDYVSNPTAGLVVGDLIQLYDVSAVAYINAVVDTIENTTQITVSENVSAGAAGDFVTLRPATPSFTLKPAFTWGNTEFRFADTAANALTATHTPLEPDSAWHLMHEFEDPEGAKRSGSHDPAALVRMQGDAELNIKKYFDTPLDLEYFNALTKRACVIRHFSYDGSNTYELRVTLNNLTLQNPQPHLATEEILYSELALLPQYDTSDTQAVDIKVLNAVSTI